METERTPYDNSYKLLFSHPEMVRDLLLGFFQEDWINELDLPTFERFTASYVTENLRERESDIVWRVRFRDQWLFIYLLIEFQSDVDQYMSARLLAYLGLLYLDIIKQDKKNFKNNKLPPILPIVLYNNGAVTS